MGLFDRFPWVNTHELNLNWIIQKMKEWGAESAENVAAARTAAESAAQSAASAISNVESYAERAETAEANATMSEISAGVSETRAGESRTAAEAAATEAAGHVEQCTELKNIAQNSATAAAQSAARAEAAVWDYTHNYNGCPFKLLSESDSYTGTKNEFLIAPQEANVLYRVSGSALNPYSGFSGYNHHYEKIYRIEMQYNQAVPGFTGNIGPVIPGLGIVNICPLGMYLIDDDGYYYYYQIPQCISGTPVAVGVDSINLLDDLNGSLNVYTGTLGVEASNGSCYCIIKVDYVEDRI